MEEGFKLFSMTGFLLILVIVMLVLLIVMFRMLNAARRQIGDLDHKLRRFTRGRDGDSIEDTMIRMFDEHEEIRRILDRDGKEIDEINERLQKAIQKVSVIKYDAFDQMGGNLSSSIAMLDENNDGIIINTVQSADGCYSYVKQIRGGRPDVDLGREESEALEQAIYGVEEI